MKLKEKTKKKIRGSITILLIILMLPSMTLSAVIVDSSRINMARSMVSSAGDLTMNTALADYDTILKDVYGLFAMSQNKTDEELATELRNYFATTLVSYGVINEAESGAYVDALIGDFKDLISESRNGTVSNFLDMNIVDFTAQKVDNSSLANANILRSQIIEYMKYRAPLNFGLSFLDSINAFKNVQDQTNVVKTQVEAQESVQDVAKACEKIISAIRAYDDLMNSIKTTDGANVVNGKANSTDTQMVDIGEYHTQIDKYYSTWGENYSHINKINLVFLLKSPAVDSLYLSGLNIYNSEWFIKTDNTGILYDNTGIGINPSLASTTGEAKTQVENQIGQLTNTNNTEYITANTYVNNNFLDYSYMSGSTFTDEAAAINTFVDFERILVDEGSLKYSDVKTTLESIYTLGKYYDNYYGKISAEIATAESEMNTANGKVTTAASNADTYYSAINSNVISINSANEGYVDSIEFLKEVKNANNEDLNTVITNILAQTSFAMPSTSNIGGKDFANFAGFINNFKESSSDADNKYLKVYKEIIASSLKDNATYSSICSAAQSYLTSNSTSKSLYDYMVEKVGEASVSNDLYKILAHLYINSVYVDNIASNIDSYNTVKDGYADLVADATAKTQIYNNKVTERSAVEASYQSALSRYNTFVKEYQNDMHFYKQYISVAKSIIGNEAVAINTQFTKIKLNIKALIDQLTVIESYLNTAKGLIQEYNKKLDKWSSANSTYGSKNGSDSFSKQNDADIEASRSQYNEKSLETLTLYVGSIKSELQDFYNQITDETHFKYGTKKIDMITTADDVKAAVPSGIKDALPNVVTIDDAVAKLGELYIPNSTGSIEMSWYFLEPVLQIEFLKYLNSTYPETKPATSQTVTVGGESLTVGDGEGEFKYDDAKKSLTDNSGKEVSSNEDVNKFGYSYVGLKVDKDKIPSGGQGKEGEATKTFDVKTEDDGDINVSDGFESQNTALGSILSGIESVATNSLENTYILSYIFNNFSYNTLIQDEVIKIEKEKVEGQLSFNAMTIANGLFTSESETFSKVKDNTTTLSNFVKNKNNNYFYGAEIEYLLYGNTSAEKNVTYTKASIYALRFAFNSIYAFTNSEIRNSTMSVGLAVQAATCGIVPYQIVQIVLQLALAAAESAVDLNMMNCGLKVAVVKTSDTWAISISSAVKSAGQAVGNKASDFAAKAISKASSGLQGLIDAGADELSGSITDLSNDLLNATEGKIEEVIDGAFGVIQSKIENVLNGLQYNKYVNLADATSQIENAFAGLESEIVGELNSIYGGNAVGDAVLPYITEKISSIISSVKTEILNSIKDVSADAIGDVIVSKMMDIKLKLIGYSSNAIDSVNTKVGTLANNLTGEIAGKLNGYVSQAEGELTEEVSQKIKDEVSNVTNQFVNEFLDDDVANAIGSGTTGTGSNSVASMITFGYKDYLMLFVFISLSVTTDNNPTIARIADMIEVNIQNATENSSYQHKKGKEFKMENAKTYVAIHSTTKLEMLFMNMEFFTSMLEDEETDVSGQLTPAATIEYNGLLGY